MLWQGVYHFKGCTNPNDVMFFFLDAEQKTQYDVDFDMKEFRWFRIELPYYLILCL